MTNESFIVDLQGFRVPHFLLKEICIISVHSSFIRHRIIRPPVHYSRLSPVIKKQVQYVTKNIHGLPWNLGSTYEGDALNLLRRTLAGAKRVYIKGSERKVYLEKLLNRSVTVIDLDIFDYRGQRTLKESQYSSCSQTSLHRHSSLRCAFKKACMYRDYVRKFVEMGLCTSSTNVDFHLIDVRRMYNRYRRFMSRAHWEFLKDFEKFQLQFVGEKENYNGHWTNCAWFSDETIEGPDTCACMLYARRKAEIIGILNEYERRHIRSIRSIHRHTSTA